MLFMETVAGELDVARRRERRAAASAPCCWRWRPKWKACTPTPARNAAEPHKAMVLGALHVIAVQAPQHHLTS